MLENFLFFMQTLICDLFLNNIMWFLIHYRAKFPVHFSLQVIYHSTQTWTVGGQDRGWLRTGVGPMDCGRAEDRYRGNWTVGGWELVEVSWTVRGLRTGRGNWTVGEQEQVEITLYLSLLTHSPCPLLPVLAQTLSMWPSPVLAHPQSMSLLPVLAHVPPTCPAPKQGVLLLHSGVKILGVMMSLQCYCNIIVFQEHQDVN